MRRLEAVLERRLGVGVEEIQPVGGGTFAQAALARTSDDRPWFVKWRAGDDAEPFECEAEGLHALAETAAVRTPSDPTPLFDDGLVGIAMEAFPPARPGDAFWPRFGAAFARLHRAGRYERYGFPRDNYLGSSLQPNGWAADWCAFFRERRLGHQLAVAQRHGRATEELVRKGERLLDRLDQWLDVDEPACLLHGDLWSGNYLVAPDDEPVLIDPACYFGQREADLAMTRLFGGFPQSFYRAYEEIWPLPAGERERRPVYELYHLLNHLNLFGGGYLEQALAVLRRLVG